MFFNKKFLSVLTIMLALTACKKEKDVSDNNNISKAMPVIVEEMSPKDIPLSFEFSARAQGFKETEVRARVGGILLKRNYIEGAQVNEGDVLFEIDPAPFKVALSQAQAKLAQTNAQLMFF